MARKHVVLGSIALAALLAGAAQAEEMDARLSKGQSIATEQCGGCHAVGPEGASPHAEAPPFRAVFETYPPASLAEALAEGIVSGHPDMPQFAFDPPEIDALIAYLETLNAPQQK